MSLSPVRNSEIQAFLARHGWAGAARSPLAEDASTRRYERLTEGHRHAMLMDAPGRGEDPPCPPGADAETRYQLGWNAVSRLAASRVDAFVAIARHLRTLGFSAPEIFAAEPENGLAIVEDLGPGLLAELLQDKPELESGIYAETGKLIAHVQAAGTTDDLSVAETGQKWPILEFDSVALRANMDLFADWLPQYAGRDPMTKGEREDWNRRRDELVARIGEQAKSLTLRDVHAENLIWRHDRGGLARIGLLDFQDAVKGPRAWDMSMLLHDARRDVSIEAQRAAITSYLDASGGHDAEFQQELALAGLANTLRIIGIFARLVSRDGKEKYRSFMPREWRHLDRILDVPGMNALAPLVDAGAPGWRSRAA